MVSGLAIFVLQPFGDREEALATITLALGVLLFGPRIRRASPELRREEGRLQRTSSLELARKTLIGVCACWLGLIVWSALSRGGAMPAPKAIPSAIRVLSWNILLGREGGVPWNRHNWATRKRALHAALAGAKPDILCVQEALSGQVGAISGMLPGHNFFGVGRDDGRSAGEYCAIYYDYRRFGEVDGGTFWLEEPQDEPPLGFALGPKRICTWIRLRDRVSGRFLRVYNTHLYLTESSRRQAARHIVAHISSGESTDALLLAGDFNAAAGVTRDRLFAAAGLISSASLAGDARPAPTYHFYGIRMRSLDDVYCSRDWSVAGRRVLDVKPENTYPSDHFGVMVDVSLGSAPQEMTKRLPCVHRCHRPAERKCSRVMFGTCSPYCLGEMVNRTSRSEAAHVEAEGGGLALAAGVGGPRSAFALECRVLADRRARRPGI
jgi:endonuclease/exonuclease/phosphatase family metal-dependent hydrolase